MTEKIIAAADGSALGNPGPAGWAWYIDDTRWAAGGWAHGTNNMGELKAVLDLFEATAHLPETHLHVICDSKYTIDSITRWLPGWKKKGWKKADGKPVQNLELMQALDAAIEGRSYSFEWVKGHTGHPLNEAADQRANEAAQAYRDGKEPLSGPGMEGKGKSELFTAEPTVCATEAKAPLPPEQVAQDVVEQARACELQTLNPSIYGSEKLLGALLHPELAWAVPNGQITDRETVLRYRLGACASSGPADDVAATALGSEAVLIITRVPTDRGQLLRSSTWVLAGGSWKLRYRQDTRA